MEFGMPSVRTRLAQAQKALGAINTGLLVVAGGALTFIFCLTTLDVVLRAVANRPVPGALSLSELMVGWVIFLPYAYALMSGEHVRISIIFNKLPARIQVIADIFTYLVDLTLFALLTYWAWKYFWQSFLEGEIMFAAIKLPWWLGKLSMFIGMFFIAFTCLYFILDRAAALCSGDETKGTT